MRSHACGSWLCSASLWLQGAVAGQTLPWAFWAYDVSISTQSRLSCSNMLLQNCTLYLLDFIGSSAFYFHYAPFMSQNQPWHSMPEQDLQEAWARRWYFHCLADDLAWGTRTEAEVSNCALAVWLIGKGKALSPSLPPVCSAGNESSCRHRGEWLPFVNKITDVLLHTSFMSEIQ